MKLTIFGASNFLEWTKDLETKNFTGRYTSKSLVGKASYKLQESRRIKKLANWSDIVYCEFLSDLSIKVSNLSPKPVFLRIHRTELDMPGLFERMNWDNVAAVIAVSKHYAELIKQRIPKHVKVVSIPSGVDAEKWTWHPSQTKKICTWSMPVRRKRIYSLMLALAGHYQLYVGGYSAEDRINKEVNEKWNLGHILESVVSFPEWQQDKEFYIHNALDESFGIAVVESMLMGLIPVVHELPCVLEYLPKEYTYVYDHELIDLLQKLQNMDEDERQAIKEKNRENALQNLTNEVTYKRHIEAFDEYLGR
ncbi:MAG: hypothetical protein ACTSV2_06730 [Candidatus Thorarchaeota archaeon]